MILVRVISGSSCWPTTANQLGHNLCALTEIVYPIDADYMTRRHGFPADHTPLWSAIGSTSNRICRQYLPVRHDLKLKLKFSRRYARNVVTSRPHIINRSLTHLAGGVRPPKAPIATASRVNFDAMRFWTSIGSRDKCQAKRCTFKRY